MWAFQIESTDILVTSQFTQAVDVSCKHCAHHGTLHTSTQAVAAAVAEDQPYWRLQGSTSLREKNGAREVRRHNVPCKT
jgi:hypothetical protein